MSQLIYLGQLIEHWFKSDQGTHNIIIVISQNMVNILSHTSPTEFWLWIRLDYTIRRWGFGLLIMINVVWFLDCKFDSHFFFSVKCVFFFIWDLLWILGFKTKKKLNISWSELQSFKQSRNNLVPNQNMWIRMNDLLHN